MYFFLVPQTTIFSGASPAERKARRSFSVSTLSTQLFGANSTNYSAHTIVLHMMDYGTVRYEMGYACAVAVVLFMMMLIFKTLVGFVLRYVSSD